MKKRSHQYVSPLIVWYKFFLGILEITLGLGIIFLGDKVALIYQSLQNTELTDDASDLLADILQRLMPYITIHKVLVVTLLLLIGVTKLLSCIAIWMGKDWGTHLLLILMLVLQPFDLFELVVHPSIESLILNSLNIWIILALTEYHPVEYLKRLLERNG